MKIFFYFCFCFLIYLFFFKVFKRPLEFDDSILSKGDIETIFEHIEELFKLGYQMLHKLQEENEKPLQERNFGEIFLFFVHL